MSRSFIILILLGALLGLNAVDFTPNQLIFKTAQPLLEIRSGRTGLSGFDSYLNSLGAYSLRPVIGMPGDRYFLVDLTTAPDWQNLRSGNLSFPGIAYVQPNYLSKMHIEPNDPRYPEQFHYVTSTPQAWNFTTGSELVLVGVVDSGVLIDHPDLAANIYVNPHEIPDNGIDDDGNGYIDDWCGWDFSDAPEMFDVGIGDYVGQDNDPEDENFHGTHVAGIIGAVGNNGIGVAGVAWNVKILPIRAGFRTTQAEGYLQDDDAASALIYAVDMGCQVINMSWGDPNYSPIIGDACQYAYDRGVVLVASAGNNPTPNLSYPAKLSTTLSVGAVNRNRNLAGFSSFGPDLDIVAPGEAVLSTYKLTAGEQYFEQNGTSMSAPFVAGAVALLLSLQPGLSPDEVRTRLLTSTDDLGTPGFDMYYGHGLLNVRKLLESISPPLVSITSPIEQQGVNGSFDIIGTIQAEDFFRYSVMFAIKDVPATILDWLDVETHTNMPSYKTQPVSGGVLASFYVPELLPERNYLIRVQYEDRSGKKYNSYVSVQYDSSPPLLRTESLQGHSRYDGQDLRYYLTAAFNEKVRTELRITASDGSVSYRYGTMADSIQIWALPRTLPEGNIDIQIKATNVCNLSALYGDYEDVLNISYDIIPNHGYLPTIIGKARVPLPRTFDFNGDGAMEYVAMDLPNSGYGNVSVYQPEAGGHVPKHDFMDSFWLLDTGNTNTQGQELLYIKGDTCFLEETQETHQYPNLVIWEEASISGGVIADYSGDNRSDLLLVKNLPTEQVVQAYKRGTGATITAKNTLRNITPTNVRNTFVPTIIVERLDDDNYPDILTADTDGDIMIFEIMNDNMDAMVWHHRMPVGNTYTVTSGDYDGNGKQDFFIGGYYTDILNPDMNFWYFEGFKNVANDQYSSMGSLLFNNVMSQNAIQSFDLDNDAKDEIILGISPNLYIVKYQEGKFQPVFQGSSMRSYQIMAWKDANNRPYFTTNYAVGDSTQFAQWTSEDPYTGPPTPANLHTVPIGSSSARISWIDSGASYYRLYRMNEAGETEMFDNLTQTLYLDGGLTEGQSYLYAVTGVDPAYNPSESMPGQWHAVTPMKAPELVEMQMVSASEIKLIYDQILAPTSLNPGLYELDHGMGNPITINSIASQTGVLLRFRQALPEIDGLFSLTLHQITGTTGVAVSQNLLQFPFAPDTEAPQVVSAEVIQGNSSVRILFSEPIGAAPDPSYLGNYRLHAPANDQENRISSVQHQNDSVVLSFLTPLKYSNQAYQVFIENIQDLAGNTISPQNRVARIKLSDVDDLKKLKVYPNPVKGSEHKWVSIHNFPFEKSGRISVYTSSGDLVYSSKLGPFQAVLNNNIWRWDLRNDNGRMVSSGIYFYVVEMDGEISRGKIAIIQ